MKNEWWEQPVCLLCNYWWSLALVIAVAAAGYFARDLWLPPSPSPIPVLGTGDVQVTLQWSTIDDIDLWVIDPSGEAIYYQQPRADSGGNLDVDANLGCHPNVLTSEPVENIFWPTGEAPGGHYTVRVMYYRNCSSILPVDYHVRVLVNGQVAEFDGRLTAEGESQVVYEFER